MRPSKPNHSGQKKASTIWGGRFAGGPSKLMEEINASITYDKNLYRQDIAGSIAHAKMLADQKLLTIEDRDQIISGLRQIEQEIASGTFTFSEQLEDIHMNIETRLSELVGDPAKRLHMARSRNDQVATDLRLWLREAVADIDRMLAELQGALLNQAENHAETVMPGYTHLQTAQPITFGFHLLAYVQMFGRDRSRFVDCAKRINESPLGAAALAGTSHLIDRHKTATLLGFDQPMANAMDAVSARDFAVEFMSAASICSTHLSRLAEELVIWSTDRFAFISLSDAYSTGSSIMPQKRNPDAAELIRAKPGRIMGNMVALLTVLKGLPLAYGKDMQEDKEPVFDTEKSLSISLMAMTGMIEDMTAHPEAMRQALRKGHSLATDLADYLVAELNIPFRNAHHITGALVALAEKKACGLDELSLEELQSVEPQLTGAVESVLSIDHAVAARTSYGGTAPEQVRAQIADAKAKFLSPMKAT